MWCCPINSPVLPGTTSCSPGPPTLLPSLFSLLFSPPSPQLALGGLFQGLELISLQPTSLTLMYPLGTTSNSTNVHLDPMEIATFRVRLG